MNELSHVDGSGKAKMVDVSGKPVQQRTARAEGTIKLAAETVELIRRNEIEKGDVLAVARIAGVQAAKQTGNLIPLCHPIALDWVDVELGLTDSGVKATSEVRCTGRTGAEMEALTAVSASLLTVYDMCKAVDKKMRIDRIVLAGKEKRDVG